MHFNFLCVKKPERFVRAHLNTNHTEITLLMRYPGNPVDEPYCTCGAYAAAFSTFFASDHCNET